MEPFSINELGGLITVVAGAIATVLFALQKSSCTVDELISENAWNLRTLIFGEFRNLHCENAPC